MNWYVAKLIFRITCGNGNHQPQFDEQLRLISAGSEKLALAKAHKIIREEMSHQKALLIGQNQQTGVTATI